MNFKTLLTASSIALAFTATPASALTVDGITWDPNSVVDFTTTGVIWEESPSLVIGSTVQGFGSFNLFNGADTATYGGGTNLLTFAFNVELTDYTAINATSGFFEYTGSVDVYSTLTSVYSPTNTSAAELATQTYANATSGTSFLTTTLTDADLTGIGLNFANPASASGTGNGWLDVTGGSAATYFDTNTQTDPNFNDADFTFSSSFNAAPNQHPVGYPTTGTVTVTGDSINVPEPTTIALLGLGLLGLGARKRKQS